MLRSRWINKNNVIQLYVIKLQQVDAGKNLHFSYYSKNISEKRWDHVNCLNDQMKRIVPKVICLALKSYIVLWSIKPIISHNNRKAKDMKYYVFIF